MLLTPNQPHTVFYNEVPYTIVLLGPRTYCFAAHHCCIDEHVCDLDLVEEFGDDTVAWGQYIDDLMLRTGLVVYSERLGCYCPTQLQAEWEAEAEQEAGWEAAHPAREPQGHLHLRGVLNMPFQSLLKPNQVLNIQPNDKMFGKKYVATVAEPYGNQFLIVGSATDNSPEQAALLAIENAKKNTKWNVLHKLR